MRISSINLNKHIQLGQSFQSKYFKNPCVQQPDSFEFGDDEEGVFGFSDSTTTNFLRNSIEKKIICPNELDKRFNAEACESNFRSNCPVPIKSVGVNSYRGETLLYTPERLSALKNKGVKRIIDLAEIPGYEKLCQEKGLEYVNALLFKDYYDNPAFLNEIGYEKVLYSHKLYNFDILIPDYETGSRNFIERFKGFVPILTEGDFYIGCNHGLARTHFVMHMNDYFNPNWQGPPFFGIDNEQIKMMREFYKKLTNDDKKDLGFTKEFDKMLREKLEIKKDRQ